MAGCIVCTKECAEKSVRKAGKDFCCSECLKHYEDENKPNTKDNVCEFC